MKDVLCQPPNKQLQLTVMRQYGGAALHTVAVSTIMVLGGAGAALARWITGLSA
jgi:hypothetical protein